MATPIHLKVLGKGGLVVSEKRGRSIWYSIVRVRAERRCGLRS
ncbi:MAG TPA: hypothetical protein VFV89_05635 [Nocardioides sp.]|nr:hypothetical protein [Nocardioides sp.]HEX5087269.1 hypothetical protein [Nocardioides sp.]